jgi:AraC-like DNA-binding protein
MAKPHVPILNDRARASADWMRHAPPQPGVQRMEAFFSGHAYDAHRHDTYAIGYTMCGVQSFRYRGSALDSTRGKVIIVHPDETHDGHAGTDTGFQYCMLYLHPHLVRKALGDRMASLPFIRTAVCDNGRLRQALTPAFDDLDQPLEELDADQLVVAVSDALLELDTSANRRRIHQATCTRAVERAREFLDEHCTYVVKSEELESVTGLDRYSLARHFRTLLGTSPYRYLTMRRLDHARLRLSSGESLSDAALASGFADQSHLTRQFKRAFGLPPGRWRALQALPRRQAVL